MQSTTTARALQLKPWHDIWDETGRIGSTRRHVNCSRDLEVRRGPVAQETTRYEFAPRKKLRTASNGHLNVSARSGAVRLTILELEETTHLRPWPNVEAGKMRHTDMRLTASLQRGLEKCSSAHERTSINLPDFMQADERRSYIRPCDNVYKCI